MNLDVLEFIRRFLQHVLPTGFMKVRYYGFLHPCCSITLEKVRYRILLYLEIKIVEHRIKPVPPLSCPDCGGELKYCYSILPFMMIANSGFE